MQRFAKFPLLRLFIPFLVGILICLYFPTIITLTHLYLLPLLLLSLITLLLIQLYFNVKIWISLLIDITLFISAYQLAYYSDISHHQYFIGNYIENIHEKQHIIVKPIDVVIHKSTKNRIIFKSYAILDKKTGKWQNVIGNVLAYFPKNLDIDNIYHPQNLYLLSVQLQKPFESENPYLFNYAEYLKKQNIYHITYIKNLSDIQFVNIKKNWSFLDLALYTKYKIIEYFKKNKYLDDTEKSIATAFLTGFDDELHQDIINQFAYSGTLHILSVSGFHTMLLFAMIEFIFSLIDKYKKWKWTRTSITISILFFYAFMTGFSAPIVRAVIMLSLFVIQQNFYTDRAIHALNMLSFAAFSVLIYNPLFINDIGFLLSFSAIVGLIYYSPKLILENILLQNIWNIISASIGAQLVTLPITMYFFHSLSFSFIIANTLIIPLSTVVMYLCILSLIPFSIFSILLNYSIKLMLLINHYFALPYFYYNYIHFTWIDALFLLILLIFIRILYEQIKEKETHWIHLVNGALVLLSIWIVSHTLYKSNFYRQKFVVYADINHHYSFLQKNNAVIFQSLDSTSFDRWIKTMLLKNCYDSYTIYPFNYVYISNQKILFCNTLKDTALIQAIKPNILFLNFSHIQKTYLSHLVKYPFIERIYTNQKIQEKQSHAKVIQLSKNKMIKVEIF